MREAIELKNANKIGRPDCGVWTQQSGFSRQTATAELLEVKAQMFGQLLADELQMTLENIKEMLLMCSLFGL